MPLQSASCFTELRVLVSGMSSRKGMILIRADFREIDVLRHQQWHETYQFPVLFCVLVVVMSR